MSPEALAALRKSLVKWEKRAGGDHSRAASTADCDLCVLYYLTGSDNCCIGCPVMEKTDKTFCRGTPYVIYNRAWFYSDGPDSHLNSLAQREVDFLKSLLPTEEII